MVSDKASASSSATKMTSLETLDSLPSPKIAVVIHKETTSPGLVGEKLRAMGFSLDIRAPVLGDPLPNDLENYAGVVVFGGHMSVNDDEPYLKKEMAWVQRVLDANLPYLGVCLGAQMLAKVLGAQVDTHPTELEEIGYYWVSATQDGSALFPSELCVYQWHSQGFEVPKDAVLMVEGKDFPNQAFRWGDRAYGLQFHPEMTQPMIELWTDLGADLLGGPNTQSREQQLKNHHQYRHRVDAWLETFLNNWLTNPT